MKSKIKLLSSLNFFFPIVSAAVAIFCLSACSKTVSIKIDKISLGNSHEYMLVGDTVSLDVSVYPVYAANQQITFTSSDENIVKVEDGKAIALSSGTATVTASAANGSKTVECEVSVANLYLLGWENGSTVPFYSKNGVKTQMDFPSEDRDNILLWTTGRLFVSGEDVYAAGMDEYDFYDEEAEERIDVWHGVIWKNGKATLYKSGFYSGETSCVFVSGNDVYAAGTIYRNSSKKIKKSAVLWKNGDIQELSSPDSCECYDVYVSGTDVYVTGLKRGKIKCAVLWKNGARVELKESEKSEGTSVCTDASGNVYVSGSTKVDDGVYARIWKNGEPVNLAKGIKSAGVEQCCAYGSGFLAAGYVGFGESYMDVLTFWKNKESLSLTDGTNYVFKVQLCVFGDKAYIFEDGGEACRIWVIDIENMKVLKTITLPEDENIQSIFVK